MNTFSRSHFVTTQFVLNNIHLPQLELNISNEHQHWALDVSMVMTTTSIFMYIWWWWCNMDIDTRSFNCTTYIFHYIGIERTRKRTHLLLLCWCWWELSYTYLCFYIILFILVLVYFLLLIYSRFLPIFYPFFTSPHHHYHLIVLILYFSLHLQRTLHRSIQNVIVWNKNWGHVTWEEIQLQNGTKCILYIYGVTIFEGSVKEKLIFLKLRLCNTTEYKKIY